MHSLNHYYRPSDPVALPRLLRFHGGKQPSESLLSRNRPQTQLDTKVMNQRYTCDDSPFVGNCISQGFVREIPPGIGLLWYLEVIHKVCARVQQQGEGDEAGEGRGDEHESPQRIGPAA